MLVCNILCCHNAFLKGSMNKLQLLCKEKVTEPFLILLVYYQIQLVMHDQSCILIAFSSIGLVGYLCLIRLSHSVRNEESDCASLHNIVIMCEL